MRHAGGAADPRRGGARRRTAAGDPLGPYRDRITAATALEPALAELADAGLAERAAWLARRARAPHTDPGELIVEACALVREASRRALGLRPHDVQLACGFALADGRIAEMDTGEGKTLAAVAPVLAHALTGRGAHVLTFNDYLAERDARWMGPVYELLGASVGWVAEGMTVAERQRAYRRDVTYLTVKEAGFDYLRDGLCLEPGRQVQRPFRFALVDEADSILIDEARIPLVVAGAVAATAPGRGRLAELVRGLDAGTHFTTDDSGRNVFLTAGGEDEVERRLGCGSLVDPANAALAAAVRQALHAEHLLRRDVDYIVRGGAVELVDEHTGRVADKRQWPDGLQAAVEAKEGLRLGADGRLLASITVRQLLRLYPRLCGMTATATSSAAELADAYGLAVAPIPPHRRSVRVDHPPLVYPRAETRDRAVVEEIAAAHRRGRPVLVGTASVAASEQLAATLGRHGLGCRVLNARHDAQEAVIVAQAGAPGALTISTNMAGRGTDIRLGGADERDRELVAALGGLYVIGTCLHPSRRIDRQLRGRAGRQGDPGSSRFFLSLADELPARYGIDRLLPRRLRRELAAAPPAPIDSRIVEREMARVQRIAEGEAADLRRRLNDYSEILEEQRLFIRQWRQAVLEGEAEDELPTARCAEPRRRLAARLGEAALAEIERRVTLVAIDRCWSEHLTEMQALRDESHLAALDGRQPLAEFYRTAIAAFDQLTVRIEGAAGELFEALEVGADGVDWQAAGLVGPAATWTYMIDDPGFGDNVMQTLAHRASIGLWGSLLMWWALIPWGIWQHWRRRRRPGSRPEA